VCLLPFQDQIRQFAEKSYREYLEGSAFVGFVDFSPDSEPTYFEWSVQGRSCPCSRIFVANWLRWWGGLGPEELSDGVPHSQMFHTPYGKNLGMSISIVSPLVVKMVYIEKLMYFERPELKLLSIRLVLFSCSQRNELD
jgi:hypothetical protein